jgi:TPR repeat protein
MRFRTFIAFTLCLIPLLALPQSSAASVIDDLRAKAEAGDAQAEYELGIAYHNGLGVPKDVRKASHWWRKAAEHGSTEGQFNLGVLYASGDGVPMDQTEAVKWYRMAAERGKPDAQVLLGLAYISGDGVSQDKAAAVMWFRKAAEQGDARGQNFLGFAYHRGDGVRKDDDQAVQWYRKAANQGNAESQYSLGLAHEFGTGAPKNPTEAVKWYRMAAEQGDPKAQTRLGLAFEFGKGAPMDQTEAVKWYRMAAEQGYALAQGSLGIAYSNGHGVPKDEIEALAWLNISVLSGNIHIEKMQKNLERLLGRQATLLAQRRSTEIFKEIEAAKAKREAAEATPETAMPLPPNSPKASGTGAIVSTQGHVLTAAHVVAGASRVSVITATGMKSATVLRVDEANDLAVLKIQDGTYSPLPIAQSRRVRLGQTVATIGFPNVDIQGFSPKLTKGEISSLNGVADDPRSWQISVPVQPGNSGGPLLDEGGNLIGVVVAKLGLKTVAATGDIPQNVNYAVKSAYALALLEPYLGDGAPEPATKSTQASIEDMVAKAQQSVVLVLAY